jgi:hypothetical protein
MLRVKRRVWFPSPRPHKTRFRQQLGCRFLIVSEAMLPALAEVVIDVFHARGTAFVPAMLATCFEVGCIGSLRVIKQRPLRPGDTES